jgi:phage-related protein
MSNFNYVPAVFAELSIEPQVLQAKFGDGYEQRVGDGINIRPEKWDLTFNKSALVVAIQTQLEGYNGITAFTWTNPRGVEIKVVCRSWSVTFIDKRNQSLRTSFEQVFES